MSASRAWIPLVAALAAAPPAPAQPQGAAVEVELEQFGVGNAYRPGDVAALRLSLVSNLDEPVPCRVQWEVPNAEGDIAEYGRAVTLSPAAPTPVWLYAPLSHEVTNQSVWTVRVFEERDGERRGELGGRRISPGQAGATRHGIDKGLVAVVGRVRMGLPDYATAWTLRPNPPGAHEETRTVSGILPEDMPDRWEGLKPFEAVVWSDAPPQQLRADAAGALREYLARGGHLVIVLPAAGNPWGLGAPGRTLLEDLLIADVPRRDEGVTLTELMPVLSKHDRPLRDLEMSIRVFKEIGGAYDVTGDRYAPLIALPDGRVVAIQRAVQFGRITIVGIDIASQQIASMRLPQADVFWNRILGRRSDTPYPDELVAMQNADPPMLTRGSAQDVVIGDGRLFEEQINKAGQAGVGLFAAFVLFGAYLITAGPGCFFLLKQKGRVQHAWVAFAAAAALFTAAAWGGVRFMRPSNTEYLHVTVLDHVDHPARSISSTEPVYQRAVAWGALYLPRYGMADVAIDSDPQRRDLLLPWTAPEKVSEPFPNVDRYRVDVGRSPADLRIPARATATQLSAHWLGALDPDWGGHVREAPDDPVRVINEAQPTARLTGTLRHDLPGPLYNVRVIWVNNNRARRRGHARDETGLLPWVPPLRSGEMLNFGHMWARTSAGGPWRPGDALSLAEFEPTGLTTLQRSLYRTYIQPREGDGFLPGVARGPRGLDESDVRDYLEMLSLYHQLQPPQYLRRDNKEPETVVATRKLGRELDLSAWFTRPCLIVIGYLRDAPTPVPLRVEGERPRSRGLTMVRWIHPLPLHEPGIIPAEPPRER